MKANVNLFPAIYCEPIEMRVEEYLLASSHVRLCVVVLGLDRTVKQRTAAATQQCQKIPSIIAKS